MYRKFIQTAFLSVLLILCNRSFSQEVMIKHDVARRMISISTQDHKLTLCINYAQSCYIDKLFIKQKNVLSPQGVYTGFSIDTNTYTSLKTTGLPSVLIRNNKITIDNIRYGNGANNVKEKWIFYGLKNEIKWVISREYFGCPQIDNMSFPKWVFQSMSTWKGGIIDNGGMVWCKYLEGIDDTYGVHTGGTIFWNDHTGDGLSIQGKGLGNAFIATQYSHSRKDKFTCSQLVTNRPLGQRYRLDRFVRGKPNVFAPISVKMKKISASFFIKYIDYAKVYDRGNLKSINAKAVRELMNTTARYGVVDNNIVGGNGWLTNWKCLHEPFFGQIALALDDSNYTNNLASTLDQERDFAMLADGRVLSRWHNEPGDEMPGTYSYKTGYYEAKWGYTIDSQTGYVINTSDLFNLNGDLEWLSTHQQSCEKALDWLIRRDSNHNGIFEMKNKSIREHTSSDWLDIVWASFENAFVNAQMYAALQKWSVCEKALGNIRLAEYYREVAARLKTAFNKPVTEGGFWSADKEQYIYWRDNDGSIHGDNLVTPVQFMAIASGICDDSHRIKLILDQIERRTEAEHLFHWPLCFDSFNQEEAASSNFPFPSYENGDIFPTWGYLGIASYVKYDKRLALKYIINLLDQYQKDGLSSQRYGRITQQGMGTDVLAGICTGVTALYSDIYGVQPQWNRFVLNPHLVPDLYGSSFHYWLRGINYDIRLDKNMYQISTKNYTVSYDQKFGITENQKEMNFYPGNNDSLFLSVYKPDRGAILLKVNVWNNDTISFKLSSASHCALRIHGLKYRASFEISDNGQKEKVSTGTEGSLAFKGSQDSVRTIRIIRLRTL